MLKSAGVTVKVQGSHMPHCPVGPSQSSEKLDWLNKGNDGRKP